MSFISYAQNLEDVMLHRVLKHVERGFYIDVGAWHPTNDSLTKAFYDRGWRGINIEPNREYFQLLRQERPEDTNLNLAVGAHEGKVVFYKVLHTGLSTIRKDYADLHAKSGVEVQKCVVPCTTLDAICAKYRVDTVHFLNIDAEGAKNVVLEGLALTNVRPWIIVVEVGEQNSDRYLSREWVQILLSRSYECVHYDGLNQFYLASEHSDLRVHFGAPPNIFDDYITYSHCMAQHGLAAERTQRESLAEQLQSLQQELTSERTQRESLQQELVAEHEKLQQVYASWSWRLTTPLRKGKDSLLHFLGQQHYRLQKQVEKQEDLYK